MSEIPSIFRCRPRLAAVTAGVVLCLLAATFPSQAAKEAVPSFFNSKEVKSDNLKPFKKWNAALARYSKESADKLKGDCNTNLH